MQVTKKGAREKILDAAGHLFAQQGFRAVGIDTIIAEAGFAKMSLYAHFRSKDELIVAYLERAEAESWEWLEASLAGIDSPKDRLVGVFEALAKRADSPTCLGCPIQITAAEFPDAGNQVHQVALAGKERMRDYLRELATLAGLNQPDILADQLMLLMDGAYASSRMYGPGNPARYVADAARVLIEAHSS